VISTRAGTPIKRHDNEMDFSFYFTLNGFAQDRNKKSVNLFYGDILRSIYRETDKCAVQNQPDMASKHALHHQKPFSPIILFRIGYLN
jgi:hypothetical protein